MLERSGTDPEGGLEGGRKSPGSPYGLTVLARSLHQSLLAVVDHVGLLAMHTLNLHGPQTAQQDAPEDGLKASPRSTRRRHG